MATTETTPIEELEHLAGLSSRRAADIRESLDDYREEVYSPLNEAKDVLDQVDVDELSEQVGLLRDAAEHLKGLGLADEEMVTELDTSAGWFGTLAELFHKESIESVLENFDTLEQALDSYDELKEGDSYPGRKDDLESAWDDVTTAISDLVAAHNELGLGEESDATSPE
jgi:predicted DNA-binding protein